MAGSPELARQAMLRGLLVPPDLANKAFRQLNRALTAKTTKFFAHEGQVVSSRQVENHDAQLRATDQVFSIAGLYAPKTEPQGALGVALEIDPQTGVIRIIASNHAQLARVDAGLHNDSYRNDKALVARKPSKRQQRALTGRARNEQKDRKSSTIKAGAPSDSTPTPAPQSSAEPESRGIPPAGGTPSGSNSA